MIYLNDQTKWPLQVVLRQFVVDGDKTRNRRRRQTPSNYTGASQIDIRALKAGMILFTIVPILAIYPLILRFFTKGTMSGALKGSGPCPSLATFPPHPRITGAAPEGMEGRPLRTSAAPAALPSPCGEGRSREGVSER